MKGRTEGNLVFGMIVAIILAAPFWLAVYLLIFK